MFISVCMPIIIYLHNIGSKDRTSITKYVYVTYYYVHVLINSGMHIAIMHTIVITCSATCFSHFMVNHHHLLLFK